MNTLAEAKRQAWEHRHWSRPFFEPIFSYSDEKKNDSFVDDDKVSETVGFLKATANYEKDPEFFYRQLLVIYAIRNQPWNMSFPCDISGRFENFQRNEEKNPCDTQQEAVRNLVNIFMNYYRGQMEECEDPPVVDAFALEIFAKNWPIHRVFEDDSDAESLPPLEDSEGDSDDEALPPINDSAA